jgi:hypothetical protein
MLTGWLSTLPSDVLFDTGVLFVGSTPIGVTNGAPKFDPGRTFDNVDFDGKHAPIKGLDRSFHGEPKISGTLIEFGDSGSGNQLAKLEPGAGSATTGVTPNTLTTITPKTGGNLMVVGDYQANVRLIFERGIAAGAGIKKYAAVLFPVAFVQKYDLAGADKKNPLINFEIVARKDMASGVTGDAAYAIELRESLP